MRTTAAYPGQPERINLVGDKGTACLSGGALVARFHDGSEVRVGMPPPESGAVLPVMAPAYDLHQALIEGFLHAASSDLPVPVSGADALAAHRLIDAIMRSSSIGQPVTLS